MKRPSGWRSIESDIIEPVPLRTIVPLALWIIPFILLTGCVGEDPSTLKRQASTFVVTPIATSSPTREPETATSFAIAPSATFSPEPSPTATPAPSATPTAELCIESGKIESNTYYSKVTGAEHVYRIYLPPCYGHDGHQYPTLYMFHGSVQDDGHWDQLGLDEAAEIAIQTEETAPFLIVMPNGGWIANNTSGGVGSFESLILGDLIPHIENTYCAWPKREGRAIGGLSRGGYWALEIAFRNPEAFQSVGGHSPALLDIAAGPDLNPQYTGLGDRVRELRIWFDIGQDDYVLANILRLHEDMVKAEIPHTWQLQEGTHEDQYWEAHVADYVAWYSEPWPLDRELYPPCAT